MSFIELLLICILGVLVLILLWQIESSKRLTRIIEHQRVATQHLHTLMKSIVTTQSTIRSRKRHEATPRVEKAKADQHYVGTGVPRKINDEDSTVRIGQIKRHSAGGPEREYPDY